MASDAFDYPGGTVGTWNTLFVDFSDPAMRQRILELQPLAGYCVFLDVHRSTALKQQPTANWIARLYNCFANVRTFLPLCSPLKSIGDELMFYLAEREWDGTGENSLTLLNSLWAVVSEPDPVFPPMKVGAAYCTDAYPISFIITTRDIYGRDIDLAARLVANAQPREIVMNEALYSRVRNCYEQIGNKEQFPYIERVNADPQIPAPGFPGDVVSGYRLRSELSTAERTERTSV